MSRTVRCLRHTDEIQDSYLHMHEIIENEDERTYVLRWTIRDYRSLVFGVPYSAHHIRIGTTLHRLRIMKYATKIRTIPYKLVHVHLGLTPLSDDAQVAITILSSDNEEIQPTPCTREFFPHLTNRRCYSSFEEPPEFFSYSSNPTVICRITVQRKEVEVQIEKSNSVTSDLRDLLLDGKFSDITIQVGDEVEFQAHSAILAARSPVFDAMLRHEMKEKTERTLKILDFGAESVWELLWYLYTGRTNPLSVDSALPLLQLADKYDVQELKSDLAEFLRSNISTSHVLKVLVGADMCNADNLKSEAITFIVHNLGRVMKEGEWKSFRSRLDLVDEIMTVFYDVFATEY